MKASLVSLQKRAHVGNHPPKDTISPKLNIISRRDFERFNMFDVSWTDPTRETVGQRKNRKESKDHHKDELSPISSTASVGSSGSQTQNKPSLLNLFGGNGFHRNRGLKRSGSHSKISSLRNDERAVKASRRVSSYTISSVMSEQMSPTTPCRPTNFFAVEPSRIEPDQYSASDGDTTGSVFSGWTGRSAKSGSTWSSVGDSASRQNDSKLPQSASTTSFITQLSQITISPRESIEAEGQVAKLVSISAPPSIPIAIRDALRRDAEVSHESTAIEGRSEDDFFTQSPTLGRPESEQISWPIPPQLDAIDVENDNDTYNSHHSLRSTSPPPLIALGPPLLPIRNVRRKQPTVELTCLQRNITRMNAASSKIVLERLKEEWIGVADASVYREMELEKQLWMLTALQHLKNKAAVGVMEQVESRSVDLSKGTTKLLSLFENHASTSFLSAHNPTPRIHHISTAPLSPTFYPNVQPLSVSSPTAHLPYASNLFNAIHAFSLPAVLPASSIPPMLLECHRTLRSTKPPSILPFSLSQQSPDSPLSFSSSSTRTVVPSERKPQQEPGAIHLTILDPAPLPDTIGPKLRGWLDTHLVLNLERQFKCINPGRLFPIWLADAGLRGHGSTIVNVQFLAITSHGQEAVFGLLEDVDANLKQELKSIVGRMLWKEMWGPFVEGERWWWEDEGIIEECLSLGTRWEYSIIKGVREG